MAISQALCSTGAFLATHSLSFTTNFATDEGGASGSNPTAGNDLVVFYWGSADATAIDTDQSDVGVEQITQDNGWSVWLITNISSGVTALDITKDGTGTGRVFCFEIDEAVTLNYSAAYAASGEGSATSHDIGYTTDVANEYAFAAISGLLSARNFGAASGSSILTIAASADYGIAYKVVASAETGTLDWTFDSNSTASALVATFQPPASGTTIEVPNGPVW